MASFKLWLQIEKQFDSPSRDPENVSEPEPIAEPTSLRVAEAIFNEIIDLYSTEDRTLMARGIHPSQQARPKKKDYCQLCGAKPGIPHHDPSVGGKVTTLHQAKLRSGETQTFCMSCRDGEYALRKDKKNAAA